MEDKNCICGNSVTHTTECMRVNRNKVINDRRKNKMAELKKKNLCAYCGEEVKPRYPSRCKKCAAKISEYNKRYSKNKNGS